ncbi:hypothetical protein [Burkholderia multivorans]|uniref:hypothetical protein n=1 Tax=Burkholderia multivorans TaxID=87883 RepID=UPI0004F75077|nr:hypothetical protein [Burkholderia multivorans]AIO75651.1 hypothetical protein DM80_2217 [Burkholderia multivorans]
MIRYFLARGDRAGHAVILEGLDSVSCSNPPPKVHIATLYMKTYCTACKQEGFIAPKGPRRNGTAPNGQQWALSGDINVCGCNPPPVFHAKRGMKMIVRSHDPSVAAAGEGRAPAAGNTGFEIATSAPSVGRAVYDEQVRANILTTLPQNYPYLIETSGGHVRAGRTNTNGALPRIESPAADSYTIYWGEDALAHKDWPSCQTTQQR